VEISFDPAKRKATLRERGLDFRDAAKVFEGETFTQPDDRFDYREERFVTYGMLDDRAVVVVWTERDGTRRVISMRHAHAEEVEHVRLGRS
jgi:uncharacterized protein